MNVGDSLVLDLQVEDATGYSAFFVDSLTYTESVFELIGVTAGSGITSLFTPPLPDFFPGTPASGGDSDFDNDIDADDITNLGPVDGPLDLMNGNFDASVLGSLQLAVLTFRVIGTGTGYLGFAAFDDDLGPISAALAASGDSERAEDILGCSIVAGAFDCGQVAQVDVPVSTAVPEPTTLTLLGLGLAGATVRRRLSRSVSRQC